MSTKSFDFTKHIVEHWNDTNAFRKDRTFNCQFCDHSYCVQSWRWHPHFAEESPVAAWTWCTRCGQMTWVEKSPDG
jgi:transcription elongation factor Elf1